MSIFSFSSGGYKKSYHSLHFFARKNSIKGLVFFRPLQQQPPSATMKSLSWLAAAAMLSLLGTLTQAQEEPRDYSPFYWSQPQQFMSPYASSGKMEQKGRTGVAAMHAVLLK